MDIFFGLISVVAFISAIAFGVYQYKQAKISDKKLEEANTNIKKLEDGLLLSDYKLKKAVEFYESGHYQNSLEVFKKYAHESDDLSEFKKAIKEIFWKETRKIYSRSVGNNISTNALIIIAITKIDETDSLYPDLLNKLIDLYTEKSGENMSAFYIPIFINQKKLDETCEQAQKYTATKSKKANESFREFLISYCRHLQRQDEI